MWSWWGKGEVWRREESEGEIKREETLKLWRATQSMGTKIKALLNAKEEADS